MVSANITAPHSYRQEIAGCLDGVTTFKSVYYCDPAVGPVDGDLLTTTGSFFYQDVTGATVVLDWDTAAADWTPGACPDVAGFQAGVITNPDDPTAADTPVYVRVNPATGLPEYVDLATGAVVTLGTGEEFRANTTEFEITHSQGCVRDAAGAVINATATQVVVYNEDAEEISRTIVNAEDGATVTLGVGETFGPCSGGLPSELDCGCLVDETNSTTRPAFQELPRDPDSGLVDWANVAYTDDTGTALTKAATEVFTCGPCPTIIDCP